MDKRDRFGLWATVERIALETFVLLISAAFATRAAKAAPLTAARTNIELLKRLIRTAHALKVIDQRAYIDIETQLISISKEVGGWITFASRH